MSMTREQFLDAWTNASVEELRKAAESQGLKFKTNKKKDMIEEAWELYVEQERAKERAGVGAPAAGTPVPDSVPDVQPVQPPVQQPVTGAPLVFEGRVVAELSGRCRAGYRFDRTWRDLSPTPTAEQLEALRADPKIKVRIKG